MQTSVPRQNDRKEAKQMATEIEILGHKAKIERVSGQLKLEPWHKEDQLAVWLSFDKAVGSVLSFAVHLPVKKYDREEFLYNIQRRGEEELKLILERHEKDSQERKDQQERQAVIDAAAAEVQRLFVD